MAWAAAGPAAAHPGRPGRVPKHLVSSWSESFQNLAIAVITTCIFFSVLQEVGKNRGGKEATARELLTVETPEASARLMEPDEQWAEPEPPQSAGFGEEHAEEWAQAASCKSSVSGGGDAEDAKGQFVMSMRRMGYALGAVVRIFGLRISPEHNGKHGKIVGFDHEAVRIRVLLDRDLTTLSLRAANLDLERKVVAQAHADAGPGTGSDLARAGVGLVLKAVVRDGDKVLMVKSITEQSPAEASGINVGDCLVSVDGKSVRTIYEASEAILG